MIQVEHSPIYQCNPDVVLREEDEDGGLLFNPDTNQIKVVNSTGLLIWKLCDGRSTLHIIQEKILEAFETAPEDDVAVDIQQFIEQMLRSGFIGIVEAA